MSSASSHSASAPFRRNAIRNWLGALATAGAVVIVGAGCDHADLIERLGSARAFNGSSDPVPGGTQIPFEVFRDDVGNKAAAERRVLFKTKDAYAGFFGHAPPASVRFPDEWAIFYAAGTKPTGGFVASVQSLSLVDVAQDKLLAAVTKMESPGTGCVVTDALTTPNVLIKFAAQPASFNVDFAQVDVKRDCTGGEPTNPCAAILCPANTRCVLAKSKPPQAMCVPIDPPTADPCAAVRCREGFHCEAQQVVCVRAPCDPVATCVADKKPPFCGGIAAFKCPGAGSCVDDPSDTCDPKNGGADCGGICTCNVTPNCATRTKFNASPEVCACVKP